MQAIGYHIQWKSETGKRYALSANPVAGTTLSSNQKDQIVFAMQQTVVLNQESIDLKSIEVSREIVREYPLQGGDAKAVPVLDMIPEFRQTVLAKFEALEAQPLPQGWPAGATAAVIVLAKPSLIAKT